jgi:superfamily I DNA/RNA helicase
LNSGENQDDLSELCENYNIEVNGSRKRVFELVPQVLRECREQTKVIDFDDMVWFPVIHDMDTPKLDLLVVDEAQDLNRVQQDLVWKNASRVMLVGDRRQSIYGFRGSDAQAIESFSLRLKNSERGCVELPLLVSRRCPKLHIALAQTLVPDVKALEDAEDGTLYQMNFQQAINEMQYGDLVMSRCNAPLISCAYQLLRLNKRVQIQGRDFGKGLESLIRKVCELAGSTPGSTNVPDFTKALATYEARETQRILLEDKQSEKKLANLEDKILCLRFLCEGLADVDEVLSRLNSIFSDADGDDFIRLSSVHRAKGLEAENTFILEPQKFPHPMAKQPWEKVQELNCLFVAITRSKKSLTFVGGLPQPLSCHAQKIRRRESNIETPVHAEEPRSGEVSILSQSAKSGSFNDVRQAQEGSRKTSTEEAKEGNQAAGGNQQEASSTTPTNRGRRSTGSRASDWLTPKKGKKKEA